MMLAGLACASMPAHAQATSEHTFQELNVRCINLGKIYEQSAQLLACTRQLAMPGLTPQTMAQVYNNRGNAFRANRDFGSAIADYDEAVRLDPSYANAYNNRGIANRAALPDRRWRI